MKFRNAGIVLAGLLAAACDGGSPVAPPAGNQAPTISAIANQDTEANRASDPISFTVSDEQVGALAFSLMSDNTDVVPVDGLVLGGSGAGRTLTVTPVEDTVGDSFVTIIVTDTAGLSASTSFLLTVNAEQKSMQQFTRESFAQDADDEPELVNAIEFTQDAEEDDFADLLAL